MAGITLAHAEAQLSECLLAYSAVMTGQSYTIASGATSRQLTRADADKIQAGIVFWDAKVKELTASATGRARSVNMAPSW